MPLAQRATPLSSPFWRPSRHPNWADDSTLEMYSSRISNTPKISTFGAHFTPQNLIIPRLLLCVQNGAERSFLGCFLTFWWTHSAQKTLKIYRVHVLIAINPKMQTIFSLGAPRKSAALCLGSFPVCRTSKIGKWQKFLQTCPKLVRSMIIKCPDDLRKLQ